MSAYATSSTKHRVSSRIAHALVPEICGLEVRRIKMLHLWRGVGVPAVAVLSLAALTIPSKGAIPAQPGVINYVEGNASIDGQPISAKDAGAALLNPNQILATGPGKVEVLLTPGVF